ncbi:MAG: hypothetical protein H8E13_01880 [Actinobacteria bacterium]|nr:hypothetical protein [Actinomycetota bacterium]
MFKEVFDKTATKFNKTSRFISQEEYKEIYPDKTPRKKNYIFRSGSHLRLPEEEAEYLEKKYEGKVEVVKVEKKEIPDEVIEDEEIEDLNAMFQ